MINATLKDGTETYNNENGVACACQGKMDSFTLTGA